MQIKECIDIVDNNYPNQYTVEEKVQWLSFLDGVLINDVIKTHEGYDGKYDDFSGYYPENLSETLVARAPYDRIYPAYLKMQIDNANGEKGRYNASASIYNAYLDEFKKWYNKTHLPLTNGSQKRAGVSVKVDVNLTEAEYEALKLDVYSMLKQNLDSVISHDKLYQIVTEYQQNNREMFKGEDGKTPEIGVDYFTESEISKITEEAKGKDGEDGISPVITVSKIDGGHRVRIETADNTSLFDVKDGKTPENISDLNNDVGYVTDEAVPKKLSDLDPDSISGSQLYIGAGDLTLDGSSITIRKTDYGFHVSGNRIQDVGDPIDSGDAVTKRYFDNVLGQIDTLLEEVMAQQNALIGGDV